METAVKVVLVPGGLLPATLHQWCCGPGAQRSVQPQYRWRVLRQEMIFLSPPSVNDLYWYEPVKESAGEIPASPDNTELRGS